MKVFRSAAGLMVAGLLTWTTAARGEDALTLRLNRTEDTPTQNLLDDGQGADTIQAWRGGFRAGGYFRGGWGGYRGWGWGGYRGWGWGGYRGWGWRGYYRPWYGIGYGWGGYYRPWYGWGWRGYYRPWYGISYGWGGFYSPYYVGYGSYGFYAPCASVPSATVTTLVLPSVRYSGGLAAEAAPATPAPPAPADSTYPYDGGPTNPVPAPRTMPKADQPSASPSVAPAPSVPLEGRAVSLPKADSKWTYPAYGAKARRTESLDPYRTLLIRK